MFDIAFSELVVIGVVALVVIGPERLPRVARTAGHLLGRMQRFTRDVKSSIDREMQLDELRTLKSQVTGEMQSLQSSLHDGMHSLQTELDQSLHSGGNEAPSAPPLAAYLQNPPQEIERTEVPQVKTDD